ncbi:radical SAM protein [Anaeromyxobacter oryzae]|uniref:Radical SAM core domain-containing protein n=1 Tax=Anaeromyxobacter oryzae TaxID=2918170 RepID=A0ABM7WYV2_9BACT|nr:radical SAM protein [Anaeromyxobacter oryzae]BDG04716.1 hypothetical protein AMOR_37120 [Anaeromyxobacter oryzae]
MGLVASEGCCTVDGRERPRLRCLVDLDAPCNLKCLHCPRPSRGALDEGQRGASAAERVIERIEASGAEAVGVAFYGGEPLLVIDRLVEDSAALQEFCTWRGIQYRGGLVTNGTLLDGHTARLLRASGITRALVTLAGPPPFHDRQRPLAEGGPSFDRILSNVALARHWIDVMIRFDASDPSHLGPLSPLLRFLDREGLLVGRRPLELLVHRMSGYAAQARLLLDAEDGALTLDPDGGAIA